MDSCSLAPQNYDYSYPTNPQFLSLLDSSDTISNISMQITILAMEPFAGLLGLDPGLKLISQTNPYTTDPFGNNLWSAD